jgi:hypothetical protein
MRAGRQGQFFRQIKSHHVSLFRDLARAVRQTIAAYFSLFGRYIYSFILCAQRRTVRTKWMDEYIPTVAVFRCAWGTLALL